MKKKLVLFFIMIVLLSCSKEDATPTTPVNDTFDPSNATLLKMGTFSGSGSYTVSGLAKIYDNGGKKVLQFDNYTSSNGPDLKVYISKTTNASDFINLGKLKSTNGKQSYEIPGMPDFDDYKFVLIWCQQFSVLFGEAEMQ